MACDRWGESCRRAVAAGRLSTSKEQRALPEQHHQHYRGSGPNSDPIFMSFATAGTVGVDRNRQRRGDVEFLVIHHAGENVGRRRILEDRADRQRAMMRWACSRCDCGLPGGVETASNPIYAKKISPAPPRIPPHPNWPDPMLADVRRVVIRLIDVIPTSRMNATTTGTFRTTMNAFPRADS